MLEMTQVGGFVQTDANVDPEVAKFLPNQKQSVSPAVPAVASTAALGGGLGAMSRGLRNEGNARHSASMFSGQVSSTGSALGREQKKFANFKAHPPKNPDFARNSADVYARRLGSLNTAHTQAKTGLQGANRAVKVAGRMRTAGKVGVAAGAAGLAGSGVFAMRRNEVGKSFAQPQSNETLIGKSDSSVFKLKQGSLGGPRYYATPEGNIRAHQDTYKQRRARRRNAVGGGVLGAGLGAGLGAATGGGGAPGAIVGAASGGISGASIGAAATHTRQIRRSPEMNLYTAQELKAKKVNKSFPDSPDAHVKGVLKPVKKLPPTSTPVGKTNHDQQLKQGRNMVGVGVGTAASAHLLGHSPTRSFKALGSSYQAGAHLQRAMGSSRHTALGAGLRTAGSAARSSRVRGGLLTAGAIGGGAGLAAAGFHQITQASKQGANRKRVR